MKEFINNNQINTFNEFNVKNKVLKLPTQLCKEFMFFLNLSEKDLTSVLDFIYNLKQKPQTLKKSVNLFKLTPRELEIFILVAKGLTSKQIASKLFIEECTVATHRKRVKKKLYIDTTFDWFRIYKEFEIA